jgi:hypothetical protein
MSRDPVMEREENYGNGGTDEHHIDDRKKYQECQQGKTEYQHEQKEIGTALVHGRIPIVPVGN